MKRKVKRKTRKQKSLLSKLVEVRLNAKVMLLVLLLSTIFMGAGVFYNTKAFYLDGCADAAMAVFGLPDNPETKKSMRDACLHLWNG